MNEMKEIIDLPTMERIIRLLAVALPAIGLVAGLILGLVRRRLAADGLAGPLIWLLWLAYGGICNHYGLDSVKGLGVNLALFAAVGIALGVVFGWARRRFGPAAKNTP